MHLQLSCIQAFLLQSKVGWMSTDLQAHPLCELLCGANKSINSTHFVTVFVFPSFLSPTQSTLFKSRFKVSNLEGCESQLRGGGRFCLGVIKFLNPQIFPDAATTEQKMQNDGSTTTTSKPKLETYFASSEAFGQIAG